MARNFGRIFIHSAKTERNELDETGSSIRSRARHIGAKFRTNGAPTDRAHADSADRATVKPAMAQSASGVRGAQLVRRRLAGSAAQPRGIAPPLRACRRPGA